MDKIKQLEKQINKQAQEFAKKLFNEHYMILFDSDSDKGEEILVSILAIKSALVTLNYIRKTTNDKTELFYYQLVEKYLQKM
jgi:hypothetical protein